MEVRETTLPGVLLIVPKVFGDDRGFFLETYHGDRYRDAGIPGPFVQDNLSFSQRGVLRGLHLQHPNGQGKLVQALAGEVFDVAVDVRVGSPTFGRWHGVRLSAQNKHQFYVPEGFAHGFCVVSESALFFYKCTAVYSPAYERSVRWDDPAIAIDWPVAAPTLSPKDAAAPRLAAIDPAQLPAYPG